MQSEIPWLLLAAHGLEPTTVKIEAQQTKLNTTNLQLIKQK